MTVDYPQSIPLNEIKIVIDLVRNGQVKSNLSAFAKNLWVVQGFAQKMLIGDGTGAAAPDFSLTAQAAHFDAVSELEKFVAKAENGEAAAQISIPWDLIIQWALKYLMDLLQEKLG